jgi:hypothetical protein
MSYVCSVFESSTSEVIDSRKCQGAVRRRRVCPECGSRWTTFEVATPEYSKLIRSLINSIEKIDRQKCDLKLIIEDFELDARLSMDAIPKPRKQKKAALNQKSSPAR